MTQKMFNKPFETELIYRATRDGFGWKEARAKIEGKKHLFHLFKVKGKNKRFGGYHDVTLKNKHGVFEDTDKAFLVSID